MVGFPLIVIVVEALRKGLKSYLLAVIGIYTLKAIKLKGFEEIEIGRKAAIRQNLYK